MGTCGKCGADAKEREVLQSLRHESSTAAGGSLNSSKLEQEAHQISRAAEID